MPWSVMGEVLGCKRSQQQVQGGWCAGVLHLAAVQQTCHMMITANSCSKVSHCDPIGSDSVGGAQHCMQHVAR
jgi:hypothetical protein